MMKMNTTARNRRRDVFRPWSDRRRRSSVYVVTLGSAMIVMVIGLAALATVRLERQAGASIADFQNARSYAQAAIEIGYHWMRNDPDWRSRSLQGTWPTEQPMAEGSFTLTVTDPEDGDLSAAPNNLVVMTGVGVCREARYTLEVQLNVDSGGLVVADGSWRHAVSP